MSLDAARGIVYVPTGSAVMDFYGGDRVGNDLYANSLLALDANTGKLLWHFQGVHHDIWDRDFPAQPALFTLHRDGKDIDALAQISKQSYIYVFDRVTGKPLFPIHEHSVSREHCSRRSRSPTQPMPDLPAPFARQRLTEDHAYQSHACCARVGRQTNSEKCEAADNFCLSRLGKLTVVYPGFDGGGEWSGPAIDPATRSSLRWLKRDGEWWAALVPASNRGGAGAAYLPEAMRRVPWRRSRRFAAGISITVEVARAHEQGGDHRTDQKRKGANAVLPKHRGT